MFLNRHILRLGILAIVLSSVLVASAAVAQEHEPLTETFTSRYESFTLQHPANWSAEELFGKNTVNGIVFFNPEANVDRDIYQPGSIVGVVAGPLYIQRLFPNESFSTSTILSAMIEEMETENDDMVFSEPVEIVINGRLVVRANSYDGTKTTVLMTISFGGTDIVLLSAWLYGEAEPDDSTLLAMVGSLQYIPQAIAIDELDLITADNANQLEIVAIHPQVSINAVAFSPDGSMVATTGWGHEALVWDVESGDLIARLGDRSPFWGNTGVLAFIDGGTKIVYFSEPFFAVQVWDINTGDKIDTLVVDEGNIIGMIANPNNLINSLMILQRLPNVSSQLIEISGVPVVIVQQLPGSSGENPVVSIDKTLLAIRNDNKTIELWDIESSTILATFSGCSGKASN